MPVPNAKRESTILGTGAAAGAAAGAAGAVSAIACGVTEELTGASPLLSVTLAAASCTADDITATAPAGAAAGTGGTSTGPATSTLVTRELSEAGATSRTSGLGFGTGFSAAGGAVFADVAAAEPLALAASAFLRSRPLATRSVPFACSTLIGLVSTRLAPMR